MHRSNALDLGPRVSCAWMVALLGISPRTPPPATCWDEKYPWSEDQSLPKQIPLVGGQMDHSPGNSGYVPLLPEVRQTYVLFWI